jgi:hypothetical protein
VRPAPTQFSPSPGAGNPLSGAAPAPPSAAIRRRPELYRTPRRAWVIFVPRQPRDHLGLLPAHRTVGIKEDQERKVYPQLELKRILTESVNLRSEFEISLVVESLRIMT